MNFSSLWGGMKGLISTLTSLGVESSSGKSFKQISDKLLALAIENRKLKEELRIRDLQENPYYDV